MPKLLLSLLYLVCAVCTIRASPAVGDQRDDDVEELRQESFPADFQFGVASSSYQIEGGWNANGKGENIWDKLTHDNPAKVLDKSNGDVACDSYHKYKEDVRIIKELGVSFYRFSLSWSRILPNGFDNVINQDGIDYYNNLIDELKKNDIEPMVTMFHWDLPQPLQEIGGWTNELVVQAFAAYAKIVFDSFGKKVKMWITINEPRQVCKMGYGDAWIAPSKNSPGVGDYLCARHVLLAHAKAYHLYDKSYRPTEKGEIGFAVDSFWYEPASESPEDVEAAKRVFDFYTGIFANPVFGSGDFPERVKKSVAERSAKQKFSASRLPVFSAAEVAEIKGSSDFMGLNYYTSVIVAAHEEEDLSVMGWDSDMAANYTWDDKWEKGASWWLKVTPWNFPKLLNYLKVNYNNIAIYITENGFSDYENKEDYQRANYYLTHLNACLEAIEDGVNLKMYTAWSLMDNFEWTHGYVNRFGLYHVDFNDPKRPRTPKLSAEIYGKVAKTKKLPATTLKGGSAAIRSSLLLLISLSLASYFAFSR